MKQRSTFLVSDPEAAHPDNFAFSPQGLESKALPGHREDHFTLSFQELPADVWATLKDCKELVVRWASGKSYEASNPYAARVPAGLHVFVVPLQNEQSAPEVCPLVNKAFGISDCKSLDRSFSKIPGARQFYSPAASIAPFHDYLRELVCGSDADQKCGSRIDHLQNADYVDITYDAISQSLVLSAFTSQQVEPWQLAISAPAPEQKVEIGVLGLDNAIDPEGITLSGFIHVVGVDNKLEPVYFTFPAKHHAHPATYSLSIPEPAGLHPKLELSITSPVFRPREDCTLNAYYTLPRTLFVDKFQLSSANPQLLESLNIRRLRDVRGEIDLEAPAWESDLWGSSILVEVDTARHDDGDGTNILKVELPVHTRYQEPRNTTTAPTQFALPSVFWACNSEDWTGMSKNPFNRVRLGYEHMFPEQTMFYHLAPAEEGWRVIDVPVLDVGYADMVKVGTVGVIVAGFLWVLLKTITTAARAQKREVGPKKTQ